MNNNSIYQHGMFQMSETIHLINATHINEMDARQRTPVCRLFVSIRFVVGFSHLQIVIPNFIENLPL